MFFREDENPRWVDLKFSVWLFALSLGLVGLTTQVRAQDIVTAVQFFNQVSERYGAVKDYTANIAVQQGRERMSGVVYYRTPNLIRIDFSYPDHMVIDSDGHVLTVYLPRYAVTFTQALKKRSEAAVASMASHQGLNLLRQSYSIAYLNGPEPEALDEKDPEKVVKLRLSWREGTEAFKYLEIDVGQNGFIRRISGITAASVSVQFDFTNIRTNLGISQNQFAYDSPPTSNVINNFLFDPEK